MRKIVLILAIFLIGFQADLLACSCAYRGAFVEVSKATDIVVVGKIIKKSKGKLEVEISKTLGGDVDAPTIIVFGAKDEDSCLQSLEGYEVGDTYAFALNENKKGFDLQRCGAYSLKINNGSVEGVVTKDHGTSNGRWTRWNQKTMPEQEFLNLFRA